MAQFNLNEMRYLSYHMHVCINIRHIKNITLPMTYPSPERQLSFFPLFYFFCLMLTTKIEKLLSKAAKSCFPYWITGKNTNILFHERMMLVNHQYSRALHFARLIGLPNLTIFCAQNIAKGQREIERVLLRVYLLSISKWFQSWRTDLV